MRFEELGRALAAVCITRHQRIDSRGTEPAQELARIQDADLIKAEVEEIFALNFPDGLMSGSVGPLSIDL